jgi:hypothetical protein
MTVEQNEGFLQNKTKQIMKKMTVELNDDRLLAEQDKTNNEEDVTGSLQNKTKQITKKMTVELNDDRLLAEQDKTNNEEDEDDDNDEDYKDCLSQNIEYIKESSTSPNDDEGSQDTQESQDSIIMVDDDDTDVDTDEDEVFLKIKERCNKAIEKTQTAIDNEAIKKVTEQEKKNTPLGVQGTQC